MPHEQLLRPGWQAPGFLVSFCRAREGNTRIVEEAYSPFLPSCMRARVLEISPFALKKLAYEARWGGGGEVLRISRVFQRACSQASKIVEKQ